MRLMWLFSPPPAADEGEVRRVGLKYGAIGLALVVIGIGVIAWVSRLPKDAVQPVVDAAKNTQIRTDYGGSMSGLSVLLYVMIFPAGLGYLMVVGGIFRAMLGQPSDNGFVRFLRKFFGLVLFLFTFIASLVLFGQITQ